MAREFLCDVEIKGDLTKNGDDIPTVDEVVSAISLPTGLVQSGTTTVTISYDTGYSIPLTADTAKGVTAHGWGNHASAGYMPGSYLDTDVTLAANSDAKIASQKAVKAYVAAMVANLLELAGTITNANTNPNYPAASKGDSYIIASNAGKVGGASGKSVDIGDLVVAIADNAGGTEASVGTSWIVLEHNLQGVLLTGDIGTTVQAYDADLAAIAALTTTSFGRAFLALADEAAFKAAVNLEIGVDVAAYQLEYCVGGSSGGSSSQATSHNIPLNTLTTFDGKAVSLKAGDVALVAVASNDTDKAYSASGWQELAETFSNDTIDTNLAVYRKVLDGSETSMTVAVGTSSDLSWAVQVFRGVDNTTPEDTSTISTTGLNSSAPDPAAITTTNRSIIVAIGGAGGSNSDGFEVGQLGAPYGMLPCVSRAHPDGWATVGMSAYIQSAAGAYNPAPFLQSLFSTTSHSWAAFTVALRLD